MKCLHFFLIALIFFPKEIYSDTLSLKIDKQKSKIHWKGKKITGEHSGTIKIKSSKILINPKTNKIISSEVVVDMTTINCEDLSGKWKNKLESHLASKDFFFVSEYPTARFVLEQTSKQESNEPMITGKMTIRGKTLKPKNPIYFSLEKKQDRYFATFKRFTIDRTRWGVNYRSGKFFENLKDKLIYDDIEIEIILVTTPVKP